MLFANSNVKEPVREFIPKGDNAGTIGHGGGNAYDFRVVFCQVHKGIAKDLCVGSLLGPLAGGCIFPLHISNFPEL